MDNNETTFEDMPLSCCDCGQSFVWTAGQRRFYAERELSQPKRCSTCRQIKRTEWATRDAERVER
ncbi:MAG: zinc-ribbon domain containing protein [Acidobacteria bacterium]|nr:zinc-ribbon domain containing protein [Acidobacteriota bacterium]